MLRQVTIHALVITIQNLNFYIIEEFMISYDHFLVTDLRV